MCQKVSDIKENIIEAGHGAHSSSYSRGLGETVS